MADLAELEKRIRAMESIEAIKKVKAKYWRCVDQKLWDEMLDVWTEDAVWYRADGAHRVGRKAIVDNSRAFHTDAITHHRGHAPEIELTGETTARGTWSLFCYLGWPDHQTFGWGYYEDEYAKESDGKWRIKSVKFVFIHRDTTTRETQPLWWKA